MSRIIANVTIKNLFESEMMVNCDGFVDTGTALMVLPKAWKARLGKLNLIREADCVTATQHLIKGEICGPVEIKLEGFEPIYSEVLFLDMESLDGTYEPLIGYIVLEQSQAAVDILGHRLLRVRTMDLKKIYS